MVLKIKWNCHLKYNKYYLNACHDVNEIDIFKNYWSKQNPFGGPYPLYSAPVNSHESLESSSSRPKTKIIMVICISKSR